MTKEELRDLLAGLFTTRGAEAKREGKTDRDELEDDTIIYARDAFDDTTPMHAVYEIVTRYAFDSGLSHGFSYQIMSRAVDCLCNVDDWENDGGITEQVDNAVPIYTHDLMQVYTADAWSVDEARDEYGAQDTTKDAQMAWYKLINEAVYGIKDDLAGLIDDEATTA